MKPKGTKAGSPLARKAKWVHLRQRLTMDPSPPILAKNSKAPNFQPRTTCGPFSAMASGSPKSPPAQSKSTLPLNSRGIFPIPPCTPYSRMQEWCVYGIIYHYAPFLLSNPMVTFSEPNSMILNWGPKIHHQFQRRTLQLISMAIHGGSQKTISGPRPPGTAGAGLAILPGLFQGPFSEVIHHSISCQGIKYLNTPWTAQLVHTGSNQASCMALAQLGQIHIPLWEFNHTVSILKMSRTVLTQFRQ
ncbi:hypothetical protein O181_002420 [Austropuccinia psidii MF-1]|uniref:Uncharacterized protein n=1 Tax=Austropuccinia psidii MF-1 TaxID=1389203 RepID=A0A9Q3BD02_9BASI|nr:hypothetical protein [Austropuccinia psidii MF-1]